MLDIPNSTRKPSTVFFEKKYEKIFRSESVNVITFHEEFLKRSLSDKQKEVAIAVNGLDPLIFDTNFDEVDLMWGQKSGKNYLIEGLIAYEAYRLGNLYDPHEYLGVDPMMDFNICNSSMVNEAQAKNVFFERVKAVLRSTIDPATGDNWFERYLGMDMRPKGFGDIKSKTITFPHKEGRGKIVMHSFDSTPQAPEGLTIYRGIMDEPSRANTQILYNHALHLYKVYRGNIAGSFSGGLGKLILFSYPEQKINDLMVERFEKGRNEAKTFVSKATTFEANPLLKEEDFEKAKQDDPIDYQCRHLCIVPESKFGFFAPYFDKISECCNPLLSNRAKFKPSLTVRETVENEKTVIHQFTGVEILELKGDNRIRVITLDSSKSRDQFTMGCGYAEFSEQEEGQVKTVSIRKNIAGLDTIEEIPLSGRVVLDTVIVWRPDSKHPVDYLNVENVLLQLLKAFPNIIGVHSDTYNSESLRQKVLTKGIEYVIHFLSNPEQIRYYTVLRGLMWNNMAEFLSKEEYTSTPKDASIEEEARQLLFENKNRIDHPVGGSSDLMIMFAILAYHALLTAYTPKPKFDSMPENQIDLNEYVRRYYAAKSNLKMELRRDPTIEEIAKHLGESVEWLQEVIDYAQDAYYHDKTLGNVLPEVGISNSD